MLNKIINGGCFQIMEDIAGHSIDMVFADLPYGVTANKWDSTLPLEELWKCWLRVLKPGGTVVLTGVQPFTSSLVNSNLKMFKYEVVWEKTMATGFLQAKSRPLRAHENILVFGGKTYNAQKTKGLPYKKICTSNSVNYPQPKRDTVYDHSNTSGDRFPRSVLKISNPNHNLIHPTQKPVELLEWLIKTYTNEGDTVLDPVSGSGTTAVACISTNRNYICIEKDLKYYEASCKRVEDYVK